MSANSANSQCTNDPTERHAEVGACRIEPHQYRRDGWSQGNEAIFRRQRHFRQENSNTGNRQGSKRGDKSHGPAPIAQPANDGADWCAQCRGECKARHHHRERVTSMFRANQHHRGPCRGRRESSRANAGDDSAQEREPKCRRDHCSKVRKSEDDTAAEQQTLPRYGRSQCGNRWRQESKGDGIDRCHLPGSSNAYAKCVGDPGKHGGDHETIGAKREHSYGEYKQAAVHGYFLLADRRTKISAEIESAAVALRTSKRPSTVSLSSRNHSKPSRPGRVPCWLWCSFAVAPPVGSTMLSLLSTTPLK